MSAYFWSYCSQKSAKCWGEDGMQFVAANPAHLPLVFNIITECRRQYSDSDCSARTVKFDEAAVVAFGNRQFGRSGVAGSLRPAVVTDTSCNALRIVRDVRCSKPMRAKPRRFFSLSGPGTVLLLGTSKKTQLRE